MMRSFALSALVLVVGLLPDLAIAQETPRSIIERAIRSHGGENALNKARRVQRKLKGTMTAGAIETPFVADMVADLPDRIKITFDVDAGGQKVKAIVVLASDKGWQVNGGAAVEMNRLELDELREEIYVVWLLTLVPLLDKGLDLQLLPEIKVEGRPAVGVKVGGKGHGEVTLYFDKESDLLVKVDRKRRETGKIVDKEYILSDFKEFEGVRVATKQVELLNGKKSTEVILVESHFLRKIDDSTFAKP
jgi:hypothetical protein